MLTMICPICKEVVESELLADLTTVVCDQCKDTIPVKNVFINTPHFTISRDIFINQTKRYKRLLKDVEQERQDLSDDKGGSTKRIKELERLHFSLHELLDGARDSYRMELPFNFYVEVSDQYSILRGKLLNLSVEGCSIELIMLDTPPLSKTDIRIEFFFPGLKDVIASRAKVVWVKDPHDKNGVKCAVIGASFEDMEEATAQCIWNYIVDNMPLQSSRIAG